MTRRARRSEGFRLGEMPCEYAAREIIPSIRAAIAITMIEKGVSKYKAATLLGMTPAAITNYTSGKRGGKFVTIILGSPQFRGLIERTGEILLADIDPKRKEEAFRSAICAICSRLNKYECHAPYANGSGDGIGRFHGRSASRPGDGVAAGGR